MDDKIALIRKQFKDELQTLNSSEGVEQLKVRFLGKKGPIQELMAALRSCGADERPRIGEQINTLKEEMTHLCTQALDTFRLSELSHKLEAERLDVTLPGRKARLPRKHPLALVNDEMIDILRGMGFSVQYGPDIDSDYYNYEGLNFPDDHPAREMQDTFYLSTDMLLRSHTSNTQLRVMESHKPPIRIIAPGTVYRNEEITSRSHVFFHQIEGLYVDRDVTFSDLFSTMDLLWSKFFRRSIKTRFRPSFFPFVEPGLEIDVECTACNQKGCRLCKHSGWLEVAGAGMVHPEVLKNGGIDPDTYSGYAWGFGIERLAMLRYGITDIRLFAQNDLRFLSQF